MVDEETNPKFYKLIYEFEKITNIPIMLNTSFNDMEPIICSPRDAVNTCLKTNLDYLIISDYLVEINSDHSNLNQYSLSNGIELRELLLKISINKNFRTSFLNDLDKNLNNLQLNSENKRIISGTFKEIRKHLMMTKEKLSFDPDITNIQDYITSRR